MCISRVSCNYEDHNMTPSLLSMPRARQSQWASSQSRAGPISDNKSLLRRWNVDDLLTIHDCLLWMEIRETLILQDFDNWKPFLPKTDEEIPTFKKYLTQKSDKICSFDTTQWPTQSPNHNTLPAYNTHTVAVFLSFNSSVQSRNQLSLRVLFSSLFLYPPTKCIGRHI